MKRGQNLAHQVVDLSKRKAATQKRYGTVTHVGSGTVSVKPSGSQTVLQRIPITGAAKVGDQVELIRVGGAYRAQGSGAAAGGAQVGQVILSGGGSSGGGGDSGPKFPLAHAGTHGTTGSDPLTASAIGAATPANISTAITNHVAQTDPHMGYVLASGDTMTGALTLQGALYLGNPADVSLSRKSADVLQLAAADSFESQTYTSNISGFHIAEDYAEFGNLRARGEFHSSVFVKDVISVHAGTWMVAKSAGALAASVIVPPLAGQTWTITIKDPPGGGFLFDNDDTIAIRVESGTGVDEVWAGLSNRTDLGNGTQRYTCIVSYGLPASPLTIPAGTAVVDYGQFGQGVLIATSDLANAPYFEVATNATAPWGGLITRARLGNLAGIDDAAFGGALSGWGLYSDAAYLRGSFAVSGEFKHGSGTLGSNFTGLRMWTDSGTPKLTAYTNNVLQWELDSSEWDFQNHILSRYLTEFKVQQGDSYSGGIGVHWWYVPTEGDWHTMGRILAERSGTTDSIVIDEADEVYIAPPVWIVGDTYHSGDIETEGNLNVWGSIAESTAIGARVNHSGNQTISNAPSPLPVLAFDSERFDTDTIHDTSTNNSRLTCKTAGLYQIVANVAFASNATGRRVVGIRLNGTTVIARDTRNAVNGAVTTVALTTQYTLAVNDYVEVEVYQDSGGDLAVSAIGNYSPEFSMTRMA